MADLREWLIQLLYILPGLIIGLSIHEFAHALTAYKLGDRRQKALGRLTLDPFAHIDWLGFISLAIFHFGWGKPVMVDDTNFKNRSRDNMLVAFAGPLSNLILAVIFTLVIKLLLILNVINVANIGISVIGIILISAININVVLFVLNLIPLPPFDGSKVLLYFLPYKYKSIMYKIEEYSLYIMLILIVTDIGVLIISPFVNGIMTLLLNLI